MFSLKKKQAKALLKQKPLIKKKKKAKAQKTLDPEVV